MAWGWMACGWLAERWMACGWLAERWMAGSAGGVTDRAVTVHAATDRAVQALRPMRLFHWSNTYLALLFLAVAVDSLLMH